MKQLGIGFNHYESNNCKMKQIAAVTKSETKPDMDRFMQLKSSFKHNGRKGEA